MLLNNLVKLKIISKFIASNQITELLTSKK